MQLNIKVTELPVDSKSKTAFMLLSTIESQRFKVFGDKINFGTSMKIVLTFFEI